MRTPTSFAAAFVTALLLVTTACGGRDQVSSGTPSTSVSARSGGGFASPTGGTTPPARPPTGRGDSGKLTPVTEVQLNTKGASPGGANTLQVVTTTKAFLAALDGSLRDQVEYDFTDNKARQTWSNFPAATVPRKGVAFSDLSGYQQTAALAVLQVALSGQGNRQDSDIQEADDYLASLRESDARNFGTSNYSIAIYGMPSTTSPFMIQFGGHHLARNLTYNGGQVSQTPQFVGSEPTVFASTGGTVEPLKAESSSMFALMAGLTKSQLASAEIHSKIDSLQMGPGQDSGDFPKSEGLSVAELDVEQKSLVTTAIAAYAGDLATDAATKLIAKYTAELDQTSIGWANSTGATDKDSYLRIDGPSVWIEFLITRSPGASDLHIHTVYRDKINDYGSSKPASS